MLREIRPAIVMMVLFTLVFGLAYPLAITGISGVVFPDAVRRQPVEERRDRHRVQPDRPRASRSRNTCTRAPRRPARAGIR